jgi:hypothetical protein
VFSGMKLYKCKGLHMDRYEDVRDKKEKCEIMR